MKQRALREYTIFLFCIVRILLYFLVVSEELLRTSCHISVVNGQVTLIRMSPIKCSPNLVGSVLWTCTYIGTGTPLLVKIRLRPILWQPLTRVKVIRTHPFLCPDQLDELERLTRILLRRIKHVIWKRTSNLHEPNRTRPFM